MPVDILNLEACIAEAERFLLRAKTALKTHQDEVALYKNNDKRTYGYGPENAAVLRSSEGCATNGRVKFAGKNGILWNTKMVHWPRSPGFWTTHVAPRREWEGGEVFTEGGGVE